MSEIVYGAFMEKTYAQLIREGWTPIDEAFEQLHYTSKSSLTKYCREGRIKAVKIKNQWIISPKGMQKAGEIKPCRRGESRSK